MGSTSLNGLELLEVFLWEGLSRPLIEEHLLQLLQWDWELDIEKVYPCGSTFSILSENTFEVKGLSYLRPDLFIAEYKATIKVFSSRISIIQFEVTRMSFNTFVAAVQAQVEEFDEVDDAIDQISRLVETCDDDFPNDESEEAFQMLCDAVSDKDLTGIQEAVFRLGESLQEDEA